MGHVLQCSVQRLMLKAWKNVEHDTLSESKGNQLEPQMYQKLTKGQSVLFKKSGPKKGERRKLNIEPFWRHLLDFGSHDGPHGF